MLNVPTGIGALDLFLTLLKVGSDVRKLAMDGYPANRIIGCDIRQTYIDLGHRLFTDKPESLSIRFIVDDILSLSINPPTAHSAAPSTEIPAARLTNNASVSSLENTRNQMRFIYAGALFHLFDESTQFAIAVRLIRLLRLHYHKVGEVRERKMIIFGRHQGLEQEGLIKDHMGRCESILCC